jgi:uncharacterized protein YkwD
MIVAAMALAAVLGMPNDAAGEKTVIADLNARRVAAGEGQLVADAELDAVALARADDMIERHYFAHVGPDGKTAFDRLNSDGYRFTLAGENIAWGTTLAVAEDGLWNSPPHRENILEPRYRRIGVAVIDDAPNDRVFVVELFSDEPPSSGSAS